MSKKSKKHTALPLPLIILGIGGALLLAAVVFVALQSGLGGRTPNLAVDQQEIDYGEVKFNTPLSFQFTVTNRGDGALRFKEQPAIQVLEGC